MFILMKIKIFKNPRWRAADALEREREFCSIL